MPHRYIGERPQKEFQVNHSYGAGGNISSGTRREEQTWVPIEIQRETNYNLEEHWARKKKPDFYKKTAYAVYSSSSGAGGSIQPGGRQESEYREREEYSPTPSERNVPIHVNTDRHQQQGNKGAGLDQMWPRKKRSDLTPAF